MNSNDTIIEVETRPAAGAQAVKTTLQINWDDMTTDDLRALAQQSLIVKLQGKWRKDGIPNEITVKATDYKVGVRAPRTAKDPLTLINSLSAEARAELIAKLLAEQSAG